MVSLTAMQSFALMTAILILNQYEPPQFSSTPIVLDFENSHSESIVKNSGLTYKEFSSGLFDTLFFKNQSISIVMPGGRTIMQNVVLGSVDSTDQQLQRIKTKGVPMPIEQARLVAEIFHQQFLLPTEKLDQWYEQNKDKGLSIVPYSISANLKTYPRVGIAIRPSMNHLYNASVRLLISWNWKKQKDMNEEKAKDTNIPPPDNLKIISLEPPSGCLLYTSPSPRD